MPETEAEWKTLAMRLRHALWEVWSAAQADASRSHYAGYYASYTWDAIQTHVRPVFEEDQDAEAE